MKANKAPEKIYLQVCGDCNANDCENCKFEDLEDNVTWCKDKIFDKDIEYTRTDAFIKRACEYINKELPITDLSSSNAFITFKVFDKECKKAFIEDFKKYIKGE